MSVIATITTIWKAKKIGSKLKNFFTDPKILLALVLLGLIIFLGVSGYYKNIKITNLKVDVSNLEMKNASLETSILEQNKQIELQNEAVKEYARKSEELKDRIHKLNNEVQKARLETQEILTKYRDAPVDCVEAFDWTIDQLTKPAVMTTEGVTE